MTISYNWLTEYLPEKIDPDKLSHILTSVGLEVEKSYKFEEVKGGLQGLVIGEVLQADQHPNADKLKLTKVSIGNGESLQIVCGAPNVAAGQKVVVATVGTIIYPTVGEPITMRVAKIRGVESFGMICAEDEIGIGSSHAGIMVLPMEVQTGTNAADYFKPYSDFIYEIGLTPNRMDAMSHWGVARDVCAYLSHHNKKVVHPVLPVIDFKVDNKQLDISISLENQEACKRYSGICISQVKVKSSPKWLQEKLTSIGVRPINNIVDITNFIQHETGQPLHAFDYDEISDHKIVVKTMFEGTPFVTLDDKVRKLNSNDLMICDSKKPLCIAGVFGGLQSGVSEKTTNIFLESAWFDPIFIRKTSFRHGLRTDAATRFEKGIDISNTVNVLQRAALMIKEITGGLIASDVMDIYPDPRPKKEVTLDFKYLKKLSGKNYTPVSVRKILENLGFIISLESESTLSLQVPYHKLDVTLPADVVEEVLRIDGLDHIDIPTNIRMSPSFEENNKAERLKEKISNVLTGMGFSEILTNSITNSAYLTEDVLSTSVKLLNNLSNDLNILRPSMLLTALEVIAFNINRRNNNLKFFEFGKTYVSSTKGHYQENNHLSLYLTGQLSEDSPKTKGIAIDLLYTKGIAEALIAHLGLPNIKFQEAASHEMKPAFSGFEKNVKLIDFGQVKSSMANKFDISQPVYFIDIAWNHIMDMTGTKVKFTEIPKFPSVERDLSIVVPQSMKYASVKEQITNAKPDKLTEVRLFDIFESEKLGVGKKSLAIKFTFLDEEKTLTDKEIDMWMNKIMVILEKELNAEIRK